MTESLPEAITTSLNGSDFEALSEDSLEVLGFGLKELEELLADLSDRLTNLSSFIELIPRDLKISPADVGRYLATLAGRPDADPGSFVDPSTGIPLAAYELFDALKNGAAMGRSPTPGTLSPEHVEEHSEEKAVRDLPGGIWLGEDTSSSEEMVRGFVTLPVIYATNRKRLLDDAKGLNFGGLRDESGAVHFGLAQVSLPLGKDVGALPRPRWWKVQFRESRDHHVVLEAVEDASREHVLEQLDMFRETLGSQALVYVHGYTVSFEGSLMRAAQIAFDLKFEGPVVVFSWAGGSLFPLERYTMAEANAEWSIAHLRDLLLDVTSLPFRSTHVLAHSMGGRIAARALSEIAHRSASLPIVMHAILAAPDIDAAHLLQIAADIARSARLVTLYTSAADRALALSERVHAYARAGQRFDPCDGFEVIDASAVDTSLLRHSYIAESRSVLNDVSALLRTGVPATKRFGIQEVGSGNSLRLAFRP